MHKNMLSRLCQEEVVSFHNRRCGREAIFGSIFFVSGNISICSGSGIASVFSSIYFVSDNLSICGSIAYVFGGVSVFGGSFAAASAFLLLRTFQSSHCRNVLIYSVFIELNLCSPAAVMASSVELC